MAAPQPLFPRISHMKYKALSCQNMMMIKDDKSYSIQSPEVYQIEGSDVYLVGGLLQGGIKISDMLNQLKNQAGDDAGIADKLNNLTSKTEDAESSSDDAETSKTEKNIELLMTKGNISREEAKALLEKHDGDLLKALVHLTE